MVGRLVWPIPANRPGSPRRGLPYAEDLFRGCRQPRHESLGRSGPHQPFDNRRRRALQLRGEGANSSAVEHLPYKQGVPGSNPGSPTTQTIIAQCFPDDQPRTSLIGGRQGLGDQRRRCGMPGLRSSREPIGVRPEAAMRRHRGSAPGVVQGVLVRPALSAVAVFEAFSVLRVAPRPPVGRPRLALLERRPRCEPPS